jgi:hypothetical protein
MSSPVGLKRDPPGHAIEQAKRRVSRLNPLLIGCDEFDVVCLVR